jgi:lysozyme
MNDQAIRLIKKFEAHSLHLYRCPAGYPTIGWGHRLRPHEQWTVLTVAETDALLRQDLRHCERFLTHLVEVPLTPFQEAALLSFVYNVGAGAFQRSMLRMKVNRADHREVPAEFHRWVWSKGRKLPGLMVRRGVEAACYEGARV